MTDLTQLDITKRDLTLSDIIKAMNKCSVKNTSEEYRFLKSILGESGALAYYRGEDEVIQKVKDNLYQRMNEMSPMQCKCCNRELLTAHYLKQISGYGIQVNEASLKKLCEETQQVYQNAYNNLFAKCADMGVALSEEHIHGQVELECVDETLKIELTSVRKLWKHTLLLNFEKLVSSIRQDVAGNYRIFCTFESFAAISGRIQSRMPNIQGFPKNVRAECFQAPKGRALIYADYISEELSILAVLAKDKQLLADIRNGVDFHTRVASKLFCKTIGKVTALERNVAKRLTFACLYGAGETTLKNTAKEFLGGDAELIVKNIKKTIEEEYPAIKVIEQRIRADGKLTFIDGSCISLESIEKKYTAVNRCIQGTGSIILKQVIIDLMERLPSEAKIVCLIHDEIIVESSVEILQECQAIMSDVMKQVLFNFNIKVELPIDMEVRSGGLR